MKTSLVLEGGAMRGMYTAGVLDTFMRYNISPDEIVGVSAGALFGVNFLSGQAGRVIRYNKRFNSDKNYMGLRPLLREGNIVSTKYAYYDVPRHLDPFDDEAFKSSAVPFYAVITNMHSGKPEYVRMRSLFKQMNTLRASGSMPFVSRPVALGDNYYLDGAICDSIPFEWAAEHGADKLIVVLTRPEDYRKKPMSALLTKIHYRKYPNFQKALLERHNMYNSQLERLSKWQSEGKAFVIRPSKPLDVSRTEKNPDRLQAAYDTGRADTERLLPQLLEYLEQRAAAKAEG